jgi:hypothetical protein
VPRLQRAGQDQRRFALGRAQHQRVRFGRTHLHESSRRKPGPPRERNSASHAPRSQASALGQMPSAPSNARGYGSRPEPVIERRLCAIRWPGRPGDSASEHRQDARSEIRGPPSKPHIANCAVRRISATSCCFSDFAPLIRAASRHQKARGGNDDQSTCVQTERSKEIPAGNWCCTRVDLSNMPRESMKPTPEIWKRPERRASRTRRPVLVPRSRFAGLLIQCKGDSQTTTK